MAGCAAYAVWASPKPPRGISGFATIAATSSGPNPRRSPLDVVDVLAKAAKETAEEPAFQDALQKLNLNYAWLDAASFQTQISEQEKYFDELLTRLGLK